MAKIGSYQNETSCWISRSSGDPANRIDQRGLGPHAPAAHVCEPVPGASASKHTACYCAVLFSFDGLPLSVHAVWHGHDGAIGPLPLAVTTGTPATSATWVTL